MCFRYPQTVRYCSCSLPLQSFTRAVSIRFELVVFDDFSYLNETSLFQKYISKNVGIVTGLSRWKFIETTGYNARKENHPVSNVSIVTLDRDGDRFIIRCPCDCARVEDIFSFVRWHRLLGFRFL